MNNFNGFWRMEDWGVNGILDGDGFVNGMERGELGWWKIMVVWGLYISFRSVYFLKEIG